MTAVCPRMIAATIDLIEGITPDAQLLQLKTLCFNNGGIWGIPEKEPEGTKRYVPVLYEISLFGVWAAAEDTAALPRNWIKAARAIITGAPPTPRLRGPGHDT